MLWPEERKPSEFGVIRGRGVSRECDEVKSMVASEMIARASLLWCEVCGLVTTNPIHWFVIRCGDSIFLSTGGTLNQPTRREPGTIAVSLMLRCTSTAGLTLPARRRSQALPSALTVAASLECGISIRHEHRVSAGMRNRLQRARSLVG